MSATTAVFKREMKGYFGTPLAYVFLVIFLAGASFLTFRANFFEFRDASLRLFFQQLPWLFALLAPAIAMRMWSEERRSGTIELLLTLPVTLRQAVLGKFLAGWAFFGIALLLTFSMVFTVAYLGTPDTGPIFTGYLGAFLMAGAYLAIGGFFSAITKNQVIAFILGVVVCGLFVIAGAPAVVSWLEQSSLVPTFLVRFIESLSFLTNYEVMQLGMIEVSNLFFMLAITIGFLVGTVVMLNETKAR